MMLRAIRPLLCRLAPASSVHANPWSLSHLFSTSIPAASPAPTSKQHSKPHSPAVHKKRAVEFRAQYEGSLLNGKRHGAGTLHFPDGTTFSGTFVNDHPVGTGKHTDALGVVVERELEQPIKKEREARLGSMYEGERSGRHPHGIGKITYKTGTFLEGEFKRGKIQNGSGTVYYDNGDVYTGTWVDGKKHGQGKTTYSSGKTFAGEHREGKLYTGHGWLLYPNGDAYEGHILHFKKHGQGTMVYSTKGTYTGEWAENLRHGYGTYTFLNGDVYEGHWFKGDRHGQGKNTYANGSVLQGEFREGWIYNGSGPFTCNWVTAKAGANKVEGGDGSADSKVSTLVNSSALRMNQGDTYVGDWREGKFNGPGLYTFADGRTLQGVFRKGFMYNGTGTTVTQRGAWTGEWRNGRMYEGEGSFPLKGGDVYTGHMANEKFNGQGTLTYTTGETLQGEWKRGRLHTGHGMVKHADGSVYEGHYKDGKRHGQGKITFKDGSVLEGEFREGKIYSGKGVQVVNGTRMEGEWIDGTMSGVGTITSA